MKGGTAKGKCSANLTREILFKLHFRVILSMRRNTFGACGIGLELPCAGAIPTKSAIHEHFHGHEVRPPSKGSFSRQLGNQHFDNVPYHNYKNGHGLSQLMVVHGYTIILSEIIHDYQ